MSNFPKWFSNTWYWTSFSIFLHVCKRVLYVVLLHKLCTVLSMIIVDSHNPIFIQFFVCKFKLPLYSHHFYSHSKKDFLYPDWAKTRFSNTTKMISRITTCTWFSTVVCTISKKNLRNNFTKNIHILIFLFIYSFIITILHISMNSLNKLINDNVINCRITLIRILS